MRAALLVSLTFLSLNGSEISAAKEDVYFISLHLADGSLSKDKLAIWFTNHADPQ
jgi:prophage maintenance system killer protein